MHLFFTVSQRGNVIKLLGVYLRILVGNLVPFPFRPPGKSSIHNDFCQQTHRQRDQNINDGMLLDKADGKTNHQNVYCKQNLRDAGEGPVFLADR